jgi:6-phosphogluconolactonase/glucosamine-6-phosphate isomerase/deaminase
MDDVFDVMGTDLMAQNLEAVRIKDAFHLALAGDAQLQPLWTHLMLDPGLRHMQWPSTHLWQALESCAPDGGCPVAWSRLAEVLVPHAGMPSGQLHPMPAADAAAPEHYGRRLKSVLEDQSLDCIVVCASADGGIGGLGNGQLVSDAPVSFAKRDGGDIITLSASTMVDAACLMVLVADDQTRQRIDADLQLPDAPASLLVRLGAKLVWCVKTSTVG